MKKKREKKDIEDRNKKRVTKTFVLKYGTKNYYNQTVKKRLEYYSILISKEFSIEYKDIDSFLLKLYDLNPKSKIVRIEKENSRFNNKSKFDSFYRTKEWKELRKKVLKAYGSICMKCNSTKNIHVDHILPLSKYPELKLDIKNLQVLCSICNVEKSNTDYTDYRKLLTL